MSDKKLKQASKAHVVYKLQNGKKVPGTTTILSILNKPALVHWAWDLGMNGIDYRTYRDTTARIGTLAHYFVQCDMTGIEPDTSEYSPLEIDQAENSLLSYYEWRKGKNITAIENELPLVSEKFEYGGTIDILAEIDGELWLIDVKTGKAIYTEMLHQFAAYRQLLNENGYDVQKAKILRIGRDETEGFEERTITDFSKHWELFYHCLQIYKIQKEIGG